jgi:hypothetical protein
MRWNFIENHLMLHWVWRKRGEFNTISLFNATATFPSISVMVWVAIGVEYKSPLVILDSSRDAAADINLLGEFIPHCNAVF